jgi:chromosome partitioning protein
MARKGGVGKTTLSLHLAVEAAKTAPAAIIDTDPQSSAAEWATERESSQPAILRCHTARLAGAMQAAKRNGAQIALIDTAPAVESLGLAALRTADFCLIVSRPGCLDLRSIGINVEMAKLAGTPVALVMNAVPVRAGSALAAGEKAAPRYRVELCPILIHQRAVFAHALAQGKCAQELEPRGKAAAEVAALWSWLVQRVKAETTPARLSA